MDSAGVNTRALQSSSSSSLRQPICNNTRCESGRVLGCICTRKTNILCQCASAASLNIFTACSHDSPKDCNVHGPWAAANARICLCMVSAVSAAVEYLRSAPASTAVPRACAAGVRKYGTCVCEQGGSSSRPVHKGACTPGCKASASSGPCRWCRVQAALGQHARRGGASHAAGTGVCMRADCPACVCIYNSGPASFVCAQIFWYGYSACAWLGLQHITRSPCKTLLREVLYTVDACAQIFWYGYIACVWLRLQHITRSPCKTLLREVRYIVDVCAQIFWYGYIACVWLGLQHITRSPCKTLLREVRYTVDACAHAINI